ncbi:hypothetical protein [Nocardia sp. XZ_19_369]|uniref:hypothetical protein n=1 Tax=Nocardia sp. XZ_19_369 TaxID=2769487 RepID=UPI00188E8CDD|nr:hypothetical protein [Nocardia sp. XZ_19_369]
MGWSIGFDTTWQRHIGYEVPAQCDHPGCSAEIDRGLGHVCGSEPYGGEEGCGLYFCGSHLGYGETDARLCQQCQQCSEPFTPTPDLACWISWKLTDPSWQRWRTDNPDQVRQLHAASAPSPRGARRP